MGAGRNLRGRRAVATYENDLTTPTTFFTHADQLGTERVQTAVNGSSCETITSLPFGEQYAQSGSTGVTNTGFAGLAENTVANLYDAQFREYEIYGRWPSPDPGGIGAANPANPQSWNRYAYVRNNPLRMTDPLGLSPQYGPQPFALVVNQDALSAFEELEWLNVPVTTFVDLGSYYVNVPGNTIPFYPDGYTGPAELWGVVSSLNAAFWVGPPIPGPQSPVDPDTSKEVQGIQPQSQSPNPQAQKIQQDMNACSQQAAQMTGPLFPSALDATLDFLGGLVFTGATDGLGTPAFLRFAGGTAFTTAFSTGAKLAIRQSATTGCLVGKGDLPIQAITGNQ